MIINLRGLQFGSVVLLLTLAYTNTACLAFTGVAGAHNLVEKIKRIWGAVQGFVLKQSEMVYHHNGLPSPHAALLALNTADHAGIVCDFGCINEAYQSCHGPITSRVWSLGLLVLVVMGSCAQDKQTELKLETWHWCYMHKSRFQVILERSVTCMLSAGVFQYEANLSAGTQRTLLSEPDFLPSLWSTQEAELVPSVIMRCLLPAPPSCKSSLMTSSSTRTVAAAASEVCIEPGGSPRTKRWQWKNCSRLKAR